MGRALLRLLLGGLLAATVAGAVYLLVVAPPLSPKPAAQVAAMPRAPVTRGFVGVAAFGHWRLICSSDAAAPAPAGPTAPATAPKPASVNQCRINQEVSAKDQPGQVILAANLSVVGPAKRPSLTMRLPPTARDGDVIVVRADEVSRVRAIVHGCTASECFAAANIADDDWNSLVTAKALVVSFPALNRQTVLVDISAEGLAEAASAMAAAQTAMH